MSFVKNILSVNISIYPIDNHNSSYLGMAVQLYVQAQLGRYHILTQKEYSQKLMAQLKFTPPFYLYMHNLNLRSSRVVAMLLCVLTLLYLLNISPLHCITALVSLHLSDWFNCTAS